MTHFQQLPQCQDARHHLQCRSVTSKIPVASISNQTIQGPDGNKIPIRIYHPADAKPRKKGLPILVFCHGGGFFAGDLNAYDDLCRNLGHLSAYIVISVDYRYVSHLLPWGNCDPDASITVHDDIADCWRQAFRVHTFLYVAFFAEMLTLKLGYLTCLHAGMLPTGFKAVHAFRSCPLSRDSKAKCASSCNASCPKLQNLSQPAYHTLYDSNLTMWPVTDESEEELLL